MFSGRAKRSRQGARLSAASAAARDWRVMGEWGTRWFCLGVDAETSSALLVEPDRLIVGHVQPLRKGAAVSVFTV
ncbi:hypothetical protein GCM10011529_24440 [Polymorphobacter glacialis]|uniref:Uncharacterized protein n=1 Tax=Sandarakinorhabdus glacialis TaxID=1614636 RepID=A0A916ZWN7_9SPHN|nr:hypothetical protein GCM10011529_24440 [Polymorphobacter glacialis]